MSTLTRKVFAEGVALLAARWREVPAELSAIMAEWLMGHGCTAEEFVTGVKRAIAEDEFLPNARRILELGRVEAPANARAGEVFAAVLELRTYDPRWGSRLPLELVGERLGDPARRAVVAIGASRLTNLTDDAYPFVLKDFAKAFEAFDTEARDRVAAGRFLGAGDSVSMKPIRRGGDPVQLGRLIGGE